uniref:DUF3453 domain-containing protein n=1 Tax=Hydatigena taeniaeformis TaxID=6205 RepID=A0A0R3WVZ5_HYDTA
LVAHHPNPPTILSPLRLQMPIMEVLVAAVEPRKSLPLGLLISPMLTRLKPVAWQNLRLAMLILRKVDSAALSTRSEAMKLPHGDAAHSALLVVEVVGETQQRLRPQ